MSSNFPGNVLKYFGEYCQIFRVMPLRVSSDIPGNVWVTQGDEDARSVKDFMEFVVQNIVARVFVAVG